ncbi:hypothetical protein ACSZOP_04445 [Colibacter massiliensis]|uniref:hypothetical protein n=1 Tax=Colibacter massiliensis TaxID=1852379 RepID=UPI003F930642
MYLRKNGQDVYVDRIPENAYVWVRDPDNPSMGWEYKKAAGENGEDLYMQNELATGVYYTHYGDKVYGVTITEYTDDYKRKRIQVRAKELAQALILSNVTLENIEHYEQLLLN